MSSDSTEADSPVKAWRRRYKDDFQFVPSRWIKGLGSSMTAVPHQLIGKFPRRLYFLGRGLVSRPAVTAGALENRPVADPGFFRQAGRWLGFTALRTMDLVSVGEVLNFLEHTFKPNTRPLTPVEVQEAKRVFGDSLDYWRIRIDEWSLIAHYGAWDYRRKSKKKAGGMAMTIYNTIHFSRRLATAPGESDMDWLIHELTHIAQHERLGGVFMLESLIAQAGQGYDYGGPANLAGRDFADFNREQQGDVVKDYYRILTGKMSVSDTERAEYERLVGQLRNGRI